MNKRLAIIIAIIVILLTILLCGYFVFKKTNTENGNNANLANNKNMINNNDTNMTDNTVNTNDDDPYDYEKMVKNDNVEIKYEDDNYIVYNDLDVVYQVGDYLIVYDKINKEYINRKYDINNISSYQTSSHISEFILIDNNYYAFINVFGPSHYGTDIYNVTNDTFIRSISGLDVQYKSDLVIISSGITVLLDVIKAWNPKLENLDIYNNNDQIAYNKNDNTITINIGNNIYIVNSSAEIIKTYEYEEVIDVYTNYILIKENYKYYICSQYGEKVREVAENELNEVASIIALDFNGR